MLVTPSGSGGIDPPTNSSPTLAMKRSGAWWIVPYGNGMLRIRCAMYNGTYDRLFNQYAGKASLKTVENK